jgi:hypothetical protein
MKATARLRLLGLALLMSALPLGAFAQEPAAAAAPAAAPAFTAAQLEQMTAPIALYPDSLVTQILMAATYPLEIVEAARWSKANPGLEGKALEEALKQQDWDIAVKALAGFPDVLARMNENLDWTQDLGDAFLAQQSDVLDAVQRMRGKAYEAGNLKSSEQQVVTQQPDKIIVIQPADPQVIYVPTYSPTVVYGAWHYPYWYYPPMYVAPPPGYGAMAFTAGVFWGAALSGGCNWGWGHSDIDIDVNHYNNFNKNTNINANKTNINNVSGNKASWNHNAEHRGGVNYKNSQTAQKYGAQGGSNRVSQSQARGYGGTSRGTKGAGQRSPAATTGAAGAKKPSGAGAAQRPSTSAAQRPASSGQRASASPSRSSASKSSAWSGSRSPSMDRSASSRGGASRSGGYGGGGRSGSGGGGRRR